MTRVFRLVVCSGWMAYLPLLTHTGSGSRGLRRGYCHDPLLLPLPTGTCMDPLTPTSHVGLTSALRLPVHIPDVDTHVLFRSGILVDMAF